MPLTLGQHLGPYEILGTLGAGGMGEVYRARDTKLNRDVALKVLPDAFAADMDRLARFKREAQVLASLNHPHIAAIYGFEDSGSIHALVLELVEGPTLAERIERLRAEGKGLPIDEALAIAKQTAEALEAAHEQGVVHRDLKPANIKLRTDGTVKVLDFGLAKALEPASADRVDLMNSPTITTPAMTQMGLILGTAAYMSPEQARGRPVGKRSDVWAFGCVLYEMLSGRRAFDGEDVGETLAAVIKSEPDWRRLPADVPAAIRVLIRRCLEKDAGQRIGAVAAARFVLLDYASLTTAAPMATMTRRPLVVAWTVALVVAAGLIATTVPAMRHWRETPPPEMRVEISTGATPAPMEFALSPDGRSLVFVGSEGGPRRLWLRPLDQAAARPLVGTEDASLPFWSPDSRSIGFFAAGKLYRIDVAGGPRQALADAPGRKGGGAWNADGTILFAPNDGALYRVSASGGKPAAVTRLAAGHGAHDYPQFLPDGRHFLFFAAGGAKTAGLYLGSLDGSDAKRLTSDAYDGIFLPPDRIVSRNGDGALVARRLDLTGGELVGEARTLADAVGSGQFGAIGASASAVGQVAYRSASASRTQLVWFDRTGKLLGRVGEPSGKLVYPDLSPDGRYVAVEREEDVWLLDLTRGGLTRFTFDPASDADPIWSPDGARVAFTSNRKGNFNLYVGMFNQPGAEQLLLESSNLLVPQDWSRDGRFLLYYELNPGTLRDILAVDLMSRDRKPLTVARTPFEETLARFSPDGRWVAYQTNATGRFEIAVQPFPGPGGRWQMSTEGGVAPRWRADGKELYFIGPDGSMMAAAVTASGATFDAATPVRLFPTKIADGGLAAIEPQYAVSRDGRFLINQLLDETPAPITLILNVKP